MTHESAEQFRRELLVRRDALRHRWRQELSEENELLAAHEPGWEDTPPARAVVSVFESINGLERGALARIQFALSRIERGTYGECAVCHGAISEARLDAAPDTDRCDGCAPMAN